MARSDQKTKWGRTLSEILFGVGVSIPGVETSGSLIGQWTKSDKKVARMKDEWNDWKKVSPEESCSTLEELGTKSEQCEGKCPKYAAGHHFHQFPFDLSQKQCCQCELVIPQLDYVELQEEGLV